MNTIPRPIVCVLVFGLLGGLLPDSVSAHEPSQHSAGRPVAGVIAQSGLECIGQLRPRRSEEIGGSRWGVSGHWMADSPEPSIEKQCDQLAWLGAKWVLLCPDWDCIETERGRYDWNSPDHCFDDLIAGLVARKIAPVIQIYGGNRLYMSYEPDSNRRVLADAAQLLDNPEVREAWHRYVKALVTRYRDRVKVWEVWNEPNYHGFWKTKTSARDYGRIVKEVANVVRQNDADAIVLAGSTSGVKPDFLDGVLASDGADSFDYWSVHPYNALPESQNERVRDVQQILQEHGKSPLVWQSECGFPSSADTGGWGFGGPWDETKQAKWLLRRLLSDAMLGAPVAIYFVLNDYPARLDGGPDRGRMGVNRKGLFAAESWMPKPAAFAYRNLASLVDNRFEAKPVPIHIDRIEPGSLGPAVSEDVSIYTLREKTTDAPLIVYWLPVPMQTKLTPGRITLSLDGEHLKDPVLVDVLDGKVYRPGCSRNSDGRAIFENLLLADSPLVLCDRGLVELFKRIACETREDL